MFECWRPQHRNNASLKKKRNVLAFPQHCFLCGTKNCYTFKKMHLEYVDNNTNEWSIEKWHKWLLSIRLVTQTEKCSLQIIKNKKITRATLNNESRQIIINDNYYCFCNKTKSIVSQITMFLIYSQRDSLTLINKLHLYTQKIVPTFEAQLSTMDHAFDCEGRLSAVAEHNMSRSGEMRGGRKYPGCINSREQIASEIW